MLGKLIKYDLKASAKIFLLLHVIFLLICAAARFLFMDRINFHASAETLITPITIMLVLGTFLITTLSLCTNLLIAFRFYRNLFSKEGYLSWTLPVSGVTHLWAKIISGYLLTALDITAIYAGILLLVTGRNVTDAYQSIAPEMTEAIGMPLSSFGLCVFIFCVVGGISSVLLIYFSICVGQLFPAHRVLCAVAAYFITSFVIQIAVLVIMAALGMLDYAASSNTMADEMFSLLVPNTIFALILCIAQYAAVHYIMKRKINLI